MGQKNTKCGLFLQDNYCTWAKVTHCKLKSQIVVTCDIAFYKIAKSMFKYGCTLDDKDKKVMFNLVMWNYTCMRKFFPMKTMSDKIVIPKQHSPKSEAYLFIYKKQKTINV